MSIKTLDADAVRALGSSQCLTDPCSVVKELVENAIDAGASSVQVEVSTNCLDRIQVRDNGTGVPPDDRNLLCARHCTSKIRSMEDLRQLGGSSLGFRGEALASAASMSGSVKVCTRYEGEDTGVELLYNVQGGLQSNKRVSHQVGSIVTVVDFLKYVPVRKEHFSKSKASASQIGLIKRMLQSYAFTRGQSLRVSFKVLKSKTPKDNWSFAPVLEQSDGSGLPSLHAIAGTLFGKKVTEQCDFLEIRCSAENGVEPNGHPTEIQARAEFYDVQAILPKALPSLDFTGVSTPRQYIAIDSRTLSPVRGVAKEIVALHKKYLKSALSRLEGAKKITDPLLVINIKCPKVSYDANIEPAKDDVLLHDKDAVLTAVEQVLVSYYGQLEEKSSHTQREASQEPVSPDLLLARRKPEASGIANGNLRGQASLAAYAESEEGDLFTAGNAGDFHALQSSRGQGISPLRPGVVQSKSLLPTPRHQPWDRQSSLRADSSPLNAARSRSAAQPLSPMSPTHAVQPSEASRDHSRQVSLNDMSFSGHPFKSSARNATGNVESQGNGGTHTRLRSSRPTTRLPVSNGLMDQFLTGGSIRQYTRMAPADDDLFLLDHDSEEGPDPEEAARNEPYLQHPDFDHVMDYEHRKTLAQQQYWQQERENVLRQKNSAAASVITDWLTNTPTVVSSPHANRLAKAKAALTRPPLPLNLHVKPTSQYDPRAALISDAAAKSSLQDSNKSSSRAMRTKDMPLETTAEQVSVLGLVLKLRLDRDSVACDFRLIVAFDSYAKSNDAGPVLDQQDRDFGRWQEIAQQLAARRAISSPNGYATVA